MAEDNRSLVIERSAELEGILKKKFGAEGRGLRELSNSVADRLTLETTEKLSAIAGIRNKAAHEVEFQLYNREGFIRMCDEAKALLETIEVTERFPSRLDSSRSNRKISTNQHYARSISLLSYRSISLLIYIGIVMALAVQFARANTWHLPLFKSYEEGFAISLLLTLCGVAHTAYILENGYVGLGVLLTTIGGFIWKYKWVLPLVKTYEIPLYVGIFLILYGACPQLLGIPLVIGGSLLLMVELWLMFTKGLAAIHYGNLLASVILLGISALMFRRHKKLGETGLFRSGTTRNS